MLETIYHHLSNTLNYYTVLFVVLEIIYLYVSVQEISSSEIKVSLLSGVIAIITQGAVKKYLIFGAMFLLYPHRWIDMGWHWYTWVYAFFIVTFLQFFTHYLYHKVRLLWCFHVVHHNALHMNTATALRNSILDIFSIDFIYFLVPMLGVPPLAYMIVYTITKFWGVYIHIHEDAVKPTETLGHYVVTPSIHQVHHASNVQYLDKNFGETISLYDKLFGTFEPLVEKPKYGTTTLEHELDFWTAQTQEFKKLFADVAAAESIKDKLGYVFLRPGWRPSGESLKLFFHLFKYWFLCISV